MPDLDTDEDLHTAFLSPSFEAFGLILDYLAQTPPFSGFELGNIAEVVRGQLSKRHHLAAVSTYECACSLPKSWTDGDPLTHEGLFIRTFSCGLQHMTGCRVTEDSVK